MATAVLIIVIAVLALFFIFKKPTSTTSCEEDGLDQEIFTAAMSEQEELSRSHRIGEVDSQRSLTEPTFYGEDD